MARNTQVPAFPDGEGARRADRVDFPGQSSIPWFSLFSPQKFFAFPPIFPNTIVIYIRYIYKLFIYSGN